MLARRRFMALGAASAAAWGAFSAPAAAQKAIEARSIAFHNLHTGEKLEAIYFDAGRYVPDALAAVNRVLRDFRTGEEHLIDPRLLDLLTAVHGQVGAARPFEVISGYRSPKTNARLHERSAGVANNSLHMQGMAIDVRVEGVALAHLHHTALDLRRGGVGLYPVSNFVHMDVGRVRRWTGV